MNKTKKMKAAPKYSMSLSQAIAKASDIFGMTCEGIARFCHSTWTGKNIWGEPMEGGTAIRDFVEQQAGSTAGLTKMDVGLANTILRQREAAYHSVLVEQNSVPGIRLANVILGHPELDPKSNREHPCYVETYRPIVSPFSIDEEYPEPMLLPREFAIQGIPEPQGRAQKVRGGVSIGKQSDAAKGPSAKKSRKKSKTRKKG